jgi:hypothetical protein
MLHVRPLSRRDARQRDCSLKALIAEDDSAGIVSVDALEMRGFVLHERVISRLEMDQHELPVFQSGNGGDTIMEGNHGDVGDDPRG